MDKKIIREQILEEFLKIVVRLSDEQYQERVWVRAEGPECNDIDDTVNDFFDDGEPLFEKYQEYGIGEHQYEVLMKLHKKLRFFTDTYGVYYPNKSTITLVRMPQWAEVRKTAQEVLKAFNFPKKLL